MSFVNKAYVEGYVYEFDLEKRVTGKDSTVPNTEYIKGSVTVATDEKIMNTVTVNFIFVTKTFKSGATNSTFTFLEDLINGKHKSIMNSSKEEAVKVKVDTAIAVNDFYPKEGNKISERLVSDVRYEGGFIHPIAGFDKEESKRSTFKTDVVLSTIGVNETEDGEATDSATLKGFAFNFRDELIPIKFEVNGKGAIDYFENLLAEGDLVYTSVWGSYVVQHSENKKVTKSAFGEDHVDYSEKVQKKFIVTGASEELPEWPNEDVEVIDFMKAKMAERNTMLATKKAEAEERLKKASTSNSANANMSVKEDNEFDF